MILANPSAVPHIEGMTVGSLTVESFAYRDANGLKFNIRCNRCGDRWIETYRRIMDGFLSQGCRNTPCRLDKLPESKKSAHERWLDSPEPVAATQQPETPEAEPVRVEQVSTDYLRYIAVCRKIGQTDVRSWAEFKNFGDFLHKNVMDQVRRIEEKYEGKG